VYVNAPTIARNAISVGAPRTRGTVTAREGPSRYDVFTEWKTIYVDYNSGSCSAQIDNRKKE